MSEMYEKVVEVMVSHLGLDPKVIRPDATFSEMGADSLSVLEFSLILENEYEVNAELIDKEDTPAEVVAYLAKAVAYREAAALEAERAPWSLWKAS